MASEHANERPLAGDVSEKIPVFLSVGAPHTDRQRRYLKALSSYLKRRGIAAETLGRDFWSIEAPLIPVQRKMREVYGAVILAMERFRPNDMQFHPLTPDRWTDTDARSRPRRERMAWATIGIRRPLSGKGRRTEQVVPITHPATAVGKADAG